MAGGIRMAESDHQIAIMRWAAYNLGKYPELELLYHIANERKCNSVTGGILKAMGVRKGVPDIDLPVPRGGYHGLRIELKTDIGTETKDQKWWRDKLTEQGYCAMLCRGWVEAVEKIEWYLKLRREG